MFQRDVSAISEIDGDDPSFDHFWLNEGAGERISNLVGGLEDVFFFIFHFIYGMSSFRRTLIFQDGYPLVI